MHLAEQSAEINDPIDGVGCEHDLAGGGGDITEIGQIGLEALHLHLGFGGQAAGLGDSFGVGVDGDRLGSGPGERDRVEPR